MAIALSLFALALASTAPSQKAEAGGQFGRCLKESGAMLEDATCYSAEQARLEKEQRLLIQRNAARLRRPGLAVTEYPREMAVLAKAQSAWTDYRDADCEIMDYVFGAGNAAGLAGATCMIDHDTARNAELRALLSKTRAGGGPQARDRPQTELHHQERQRLEAEQAVLLDGVTARLKRPGPPSTDYPAAAAALMRAQAAWITYSTTHCVLVDHLLGSGKSVGPAFETCRIAHYRTCNDVLRAWLQEYLSNDA
ncbi:lysozyme inhibitor LprI family protein [Sphingomonas sp. ASY06-1R]|uniref:lysozyme inhibitor LprI family protein n=1 Tax=Sphingomonas sp. ASY06-1R TaxID=3445771 RepID=UPI003FA32701